MEQRFEKAFDLTGFERAAFTGLAGQTHVRTPVGGRRIELMRVGDMVVTRDYGLLPVRHVFKQSIDSLALSANAENSPVHITTRAVGPMMPTRNVIMAPAQRLILPAYLLSCEVEGGGGLMEAKGLAGTSDLIWCDRGAEDAPFYNLVFDRHAVFHADGLAVESYRPTPETLRDLDDEIRTDLTRMFPQLAAKQSAYPALPYQPVRGRDYLPSFA